MDNLEEVLQSLNEFGQNPEKNLSPELEQLLQHIAKTGRTVFPWPLLKPLIRFKLEKLNIIDIHNNIPSNNTSMTSQRESKVLTDFFESSCPTGAYISDPTTKSQDFLPTVEKLINNLNCFSGTPFTIQRICELITEPRKHYKTSDKFLRGVEKTILVVSTVQPDGSLITRSVGPHLTNGIVSPTESTIPVNANSSPPNKPSHNSLLNTNFQETDTITNAPSTNEPANQKTETGMTEENCKVNSSPEVSASQNGHIEKECASQQGVKKSLENTPDQKESIAKKCEGLPEDVHTVEQAQQKEKTNVSDEKLSDVVTQTLVTETTSKETTNIENEEKPTVEQTENKDNEKMDES